MRSIALAAILLTAITSATVAQPAPSGPAPAPAKPNANPCSDEVSAALQKLRKSSWFHMDTKMLTENGPTSMQVDYVLPDRMHQKMTLDLTKTTSELILVGNDAWSRQGDGSWHPLKPDVAEHLKGQMQDSVVKQQTDIGSYSCKGRTKLDGRDVLAYKLETEPEKGSTATNQAFRMFYVDALTGLPVSNALLVPGHEDKPIFKTNYAFPLDLKIDAPKDVAQTGPAAPSTAPARTAPAQKDAPPEGK